MGTGNGRKICFYMMVDGQPVAVEPKFAEITYTDQETVKSPMPEYKCEIRMSLPKSMRCRNRKRFVKLLMSYGASRNAAAEVARYIAWRNGRGMPRLYKVSYWEYFMDLLLQGKLQKKEKRPYVYYGRAGGDVEAGV